MNKKLIIAAALCGLALGSRAQTEKGNFLLGGNFSFNSNKTDEKYPRTNSFTIGPQIGYFISDNFAIGLKIAYGYSRQKPFVEYTQNEGQPFRYARSGYREEGLYINPFVRYYVNLNTKLKFFGAFSATIGDQRGKSIGENQNNSFYGTQNKSYGLILAPGLAFFPTKKLAIEFSTLLLNYQRYKWSSYSITGNRQVITDDFTTDNLYFGVSTIQPSIGINYHF
ncbi:hypothetical protein DBR43_20195 [Pedobacter sp. KBW06]|uniref:outer membrane beta-barrel protein n=1 Tax=Pedobacter sp. KBW06 TaxID=2153359 RepID=UPI000F59CC55|nr:outer membrane beta-barrel protein [Pedobacter sp. KBW06]RQO70345.1 hypothetical protein DBR43_20195 [Pedobacter sp. KBW06]